MRRLLRLALAASLLYGSGAHWAAVQAAGWAGMLVARTTVSGFDEALTTTFDGAHPCGVCLVVEKGASQQAPARLAPPSVHFIAVDVPSVSVVLAPVALEDAPSSRTAPPSCRPSAPPPKAFLPA